MPPMLPHEILLLVAGMLVGAIGLWMLPSCGHTDCTQAHKGHLLASVSADAARSHAAFHSSANPSPTCALCADRRRNRPPDDKGSG